MTTRTKPKPVSVVGPDGAPELPDVGCEFSARCTACPWRTCIHELPAADRRLFGLAWRTLQTFRAALDGAIET